MRIAIYMTSSGEIQPPLDSIILSRRKVLLAAGVAVAQAVFPAPKVDAQVQAEDRITVDDIKKRMQEKFGLVLPSNEDIQAFSAASIDPMIESASASILPPTLSWDTDRILFLEKCYDFLPRAYSAPNESDVLSVYLADISSLKGGLQGGLYKRGNRAFKVLNSSTFTIGEAYERKTAAMTLVHEGTHRLDSHIKDGNQYESYPEIDAIFGGSFADNALLVTQQVDENWNKVRSPLNPSYKDLFVVYYKLRHGLLHRDFGQPHTPHELVARFAEFRLEGKNFVKEKVSLLLTPYIAVQLEEYVNSRYFKDWEGDSYLPLLNP